ncbi:hypothetical protein FUAX_04940 [Fulvitalea axinellae]|uniref:Immunity protein 30 domain-containing protein n=1 Tax=Fulvitalea axinellae TaxID=1182444 RepID=A0AAU9CRS5_9BACT|nr:hypothetical protein FUAX_04940 [Fulvitalea axinellae]
MGIEEIISRIAVFSPDEDAEDYEISEFFDEIRENVHKLGGLSEEEQRRLIKALFRYIRKRDSEEDENFSLIHFIEQIDKSLFDIYYIELFEFNRNHGAITSVLLLNRFVNTLDGKEWENGVALLKSIADNPEYPILVKEGAKSFYEFQMGK